MPVLQKVTPTDFEIKVQMAAPPKSIGGPTNNAKIHITIPVLQQVTPIDLEIEAEIAASPKSIGGPLFAL